MKNLMRYKGYLGSVEYSEEDEILHGKVLGIRSLLSYEAETIKELRRIFEETVDEYLEDCKVDGREPNKTSIEMLQQDMSEMYENSIKEYIAI